MSYEMGPGGAAAAKLHVVERKDPTPTIPGAGGVHHVAFRTPDDAQLRCVGRRGSSELRIPNSGKVDRYLFPQPLFP